MKHVLPRSGWLVLFAMLLISMSLRAGSADMPLAVQRAWSRATPPGATVGVAFFEVRNTGPADVLQSIESPLTPRVEMHETQMVDGVMQMRQAMSVAVPAHGTVVFQPGALHAMLLDLKRPLRVGDTLTMTLVFQNAGRIVVQVPVLEIGASAPAASNSIAAPSASAASDSVSARGTPYRLAAWPDNLAAPDFTLKDTRGRTRTPADYRSRLLVVFFGFTHCPDVCPAGLFKLAQVEKQLGAVAGRVQFVFVTLDPARDAPDVLEHYVQAFDPSFVGLTGSEAAIDAAATSFHVEYAKVATAHDYTLDHSTGMFILDENGRLRLVGSAASATADFVHDLTILANR